MGPPPPPPPPPPTRTHHVMPIRGWGLPCDDPPSLLLQIVSAVQYCHQKFIVHRDLKVRSARAARPWSPGDPQPPSCPSLPTSPISLPQSSWSPSPRCPLSHWHRPLTPDPWRHPGHPLTPPKAAPRDPQDPLETPRDPQGSTQGPPGHHGNTQGPLGQHPGTPRMPC